MEKPAIFIVEDEAIVANDIQETLKSLGYVVTGIARSGETAIEKVKETKPDLVLMDIHLAGEMDGVEAAGKIHVLYDIPIIYLTAYADKLLLDRAKITEPYGYILKPYDERELHSVIEMALYKSKLEREIKKRDAILFAVSSAVEWLLRISGADPETQKKIHDFNIIDMRDILEPIGFALDASSIGIFTIKPNPSGSDIIGMKYEWTAQDSAASMYKPELKEMNFASTGLSRWKEALQKGEVIIAPASTVTETEKRFFYLLEMKSAVILPIFIRNNLWGFIGFFNKYERTRSSDEIEALRITANLLGAAMGYR